MALSYEEVVETSVGVTGVYVIGPAEVDIPDTLPPEPEPSYPILVITPLTGLNVLKDIPVQLETLAFANPLGGPLFYQWQHRPIGSPTFIDIPGEVLDTYSFVSVLSKRDFQYRCKYTTNDQLAYSDFVSLTIIDTLSYIKLAVYNKL
jgi:hypothetical protein